MAISSSAKAGFDLLMMVAASLIVILSAATVLAMPFIMWALIANPQPGAWGTVWIILAAVLPFYIGALAVAVIKDPEVVHFGKMAVAAAIVVGAFPGWY